MNDRFASKYGPWALVTGASEGLGAEFARQIAARGVNVVLVARTAAKLEQRAAEIEREFHVSTRVVPLDLARDDFLPELLAAIDGLEIGLLVSNAGISTVGPFLDREPDYLLRQLYVNTRAALVLTRHLGEQMVGRHRGGVILLSSGSALHGTPWSANYAGTKAYNLMLAEALWYEWKPLGVDVLGFMAGATRTSGWAANGPQRSLIVPVMDAAPTVAVALRSLGRHPSATPGHVNRLGYWFMGMLPRALAVRMLGNQMRTIFGPFDGVPKVAP